LIALKARFLLASVVKAAISLASPAELIPFTRQNAHLLPALPPAVSLPVITSLPLFCGSNVLFHALEAFVALSCKRYSSVSAK